MIGARCGGIAAASFSLAIVGLRAACALQPPVTARAPLHHKGHRRIVTAE